MSIGSRIRNRRIELGLSQDDLAHLLGYKSRSSINKIELDQRNLTQSRILAIADALETTPSYIMGWDEVEALSDRAIDFGRRAAALPPEKQALLEAYLQALKDI